MLISAFVPVVTAAPTTTSAATRKPKPVSHARDAYRPSHVKRKQPIAAACPAPVYMTLDQAIQMADFVRNQAPSFVDRDAEVAKYLKLAVKDAYSLADTMKIVAAIKRDATASLVQDELLMKALGRGVELIRSSADAVKVADAAAHNFISYGDQDKIANLALNRGIYYARNLNDIQGIIGATQRDVINFKLQEELMRKAYTWQPVQPWQPCP